MAGLSAARAIDMAAIAEPRRGQRGHAAELAAAENADGRARRDDHHRWSGRFGHRGRSARLRQALEPRAAIVVVAERQDGGGSSAALIAPGLADGQRADRHAGRHLRDGEQAVEALEGLRSRPARPAPAAASSTRSCPADGRRRRRRR